MIAHATVLAWQEYVRLDLARYAEHTGGTGQLWSDRPESLRFLARRRAGSTDEYAYTGPWHIVRKHVTTEFRQWVEEFEASERLTLTDYAAKLRAERVEVAYFDSADRALDRLVEMRRILAERDAVIVDAARKGASKVAIANAIGISRQQVHAIIADAEAADGAAVEPVALQLSGFADDVIVGELVEIDGRLEEVF
ncbi:hypothetical protein O1W71_02050 [Microbacterium sp. H37-C3]|jgi:hypothetical protein|uniref:hypothetical protein n=1 Tax=Microbacterium sp. H37-C3 TaxID=3004354 RepID=UPI0022B0663B|nr:hypothetical protein [Microbacterium sp. H37-C3]MCZ4066450.1 hypothetical protein [Microbacterium sp. H37-C3]